MAPRNGKVLAVLEKALKENHGQESEFLQQKLSGLQRARDRIQKRMEIMYEDRLDQRISAEDFDRKRDSCLQEKEDISLEIQRLEKDNSHYHRTGMLIHELALRAREIYLSPKAETEDRRMLLSYAFTSLTLKNGELSVEYTPAFEFLAKWVPSINTTFEQQKQRSNKRQKAASATSCPTLLPG